MKPEWADLRRVDWPPDPYMDGPYPRTGKTCSRCKEWKPLDAFRLDPKIKSWWSSWCKACSAESKRLWWERHPDYNERRRVPPTTVTCTECGKTFQGRKDRLTCSRRCRDKRYARLHPEAWRAQRRRHDARVRTRRRGKA